jgi:hypothetical protein
LFLTMLVSGTKCENLTKKIFFSVKILGIDDISTFLTFGSTK